MKRIPTFQQIFSVYGVITLIIYSWTLLQFFWRFPSWEQFLAAGDIFIILVYSMAINLLESLSVLVVLMLISIVLPASWFKVSFVSRASILVILGSGYAIYVSRYLTSALGYYYPSKLIRLTPAIGILIFGVACILDRVPLIQKIAGEFADRASIFSYIFTPLSLLSLITVIIRNIF